MKGMASGYKPGLTLEFRVVPYKIYINTGDILYTGDI